MGHPAIRVAILNKEKRALIALLSCQAKYIEQLRSELEKAKEDLSLRESQLYVALEMQQTSAQERAQNRGKKKR